MGYLKVDFGITGEQVGFLKTLWHQGQFSAASYMEVALSAKQNITDEDDYMDISKMNNKMSSLCFIRKEIISGKIRTFVSISITLTNLTRIERCNCTTIVDITNLTGESFIVGCASGDVPIRCVIEAPEDVIANLGIAEEIRLKDENVDKENEKFFDDAKDAIYRGEVYKYINQDQYNESTSRYLQNKIEEFKTKIDSQRNNPQPNDLYRGIGAEVLVEKGVGLKIIDIFSPEIKRFTANGSEANLVFGQIITHVETTKGGVTEFRSVLALTNEEIAEAFHFNGVVKFKIDDQEYQCDNTKNKSAIFSPNTAKTLQNNHSFVAYSELLNQNLELNSQQDADKENLNKMPRSPSNQSLGSEFAISRSPSISSGVMVGQESPSAKLQSLSTESLGANGGEEVLNTTPGGSISSGVMVSQESPSAKLQSLSTESLGSNGGGEVLNTTPRGSISSGVIVSLASQVFERASF